MASKMPIRKDHKDYQIGWISALSIEQTAAVGMLDVRHANLPKRPSDSNAYNLGSIGEHDVVIACLPEGRIGTNSAATVAMNMVATFPHIKFVLMVGIGSGIPLKVRLGDVVVSVPVGQYPGVVQWDMGKAEQGGSFRRTGALNNPPTSLLTAISKLRTEHDLAGPKIPIYLREFAAKYPTASAKFAKTDKMKDVLFEATYDHKQDENESTDLGKAGVPKLIGATEHGLWQEKGVDIEEEEEEEKSEEGDDIDDDDDDEEIEEDYNHDCRYCDPDKIVKRRDRASKVHYGLIASGNQVIKDAARRKSLVAELGGNVACIEMEAAGLMNDFPCIVVRGICDYADSHKNKAWQGYASAAAAAFAKELLGYVDSSDVEQERELKALLSDISNTTKSINESTTAIKNIHAKRENKQMIDWLSTDLYGAQQSSNLKEWHPKTGGWFLHSQEFQDWLQSKGGTLVCPGMPGAGKTTMAAAAIKNLSTSFPRSGTVGLAYVFFKFSRQREQTAELVLSSLLAQLLQGQPFIPDQIRQLYDHHENYGTRPTLDELSMALRAVLCERERVFIVLDALDECRPEDQCRADIFREIRLLRKDFSINLLVTLRRTGSIEGISKHARCLPIIPPSEDIQICLRNWMQDRDSELFDDEFAILRLLL